MSVSEPLGFTRCPICDAPAKRVRTCAQITEGAEAGRVRVRTFIRCTREGCGYAESYAHATPDDE